MSTKKALVALAILLIGATGVAANLWWREPAAPDVQVEEVSRRDLTATVSGSGAIRPAREVDISSNVMGRITRLGVAEGEIIRRGDFLLEIDPQRLRSTVDQMEASLESAKTQLGLAQQNLAFARQTLDRREGLYQQQLISREAYDQAVQDVQTQERNEQMRHLDITRLEAQLEQARYDLTQVRIDSPIDGIITRLNVEEGENVVTGTMNNAGTVIMTVADLSTLEAEIEVDETDIVNVDIGQQATVHIDAFPDQEFDAAVTEVGKSPMQALGSAAASGQAVNFKVVVRLDESVAGARPGLSCTADVITANRSQVLAVPIQALLLREVKLDQNGKVVRDWQAPVAATADSNGAAEATSMGAGNDTSSTAAKAKDSDKQEREGAFLLRDGKAVFVPIEIGIAGERHFEVLSGVEAGDKIITGPFDLIRTLMDGDPVREKTNSAAALTPGGAK
ncbi:MAG: efflux RND transporter periplasmic adaptor subunit [Acidobacteriota bacterium]